MTCALVPGVVWIYGFLTIYSRKLNVSQGATRRKTSRDWISLRWYSRARYPGGATEPYLSGSGTDAGAEQWYKTIAKLMQGRNEQSTPTQRTSMLLVALQRAALRRSTSN